MKYIYIYGLAYVSVSLAVYYISREYFLNVALLF